MEILYGPEENLQQKNEVPMSHEKKETRIRFAVSAAQGDFRWARPRTPRGISSGRISRFSALFS